MSEGPPILRGNKAGATVTERDFRGLRMLRDLAGEQFACGVILYCGAKTLPFGDRCWAVPMAALWEA